MRLFFPALATVAVGWGVVLASPKPVRRPRPFAERRAIAEQMCRKQGPVCRLVVRADAPRDLTGAACICD
jgi:hypothetical protein